MTGSWDSFLKEHGRLRRGVERIREVAGSVGKGSAATLRPAIDQVYGFLSHQLLPHIAVEERVLYPVIAGTVSLQAAAKAMHRDHMQVQAFIRELAEARAGLDGELADETAEELRRILYGLYAVLVLHMGDEESVCLPALEGALPAERIRMLEEGMELFDLAEQAAE